MTNATTRPRAYLIHTVSPLHAGVGEGVGAINLPTAREKLTDYPFVPGSSVKGVLRAHARGRSSSAAITRDEWAMFGPPTERAGEARGGVVFSDASILWLPVRSLYGTFAWVTCANVLRRFQRDAHDTAWAQGIDLDALRRETSVVVAKNTALRLAGMKELLVQDMVFPDVRESDALTAFASWTGKVLFGNDASFFVERALCVSDNDFGFFCRTALEIRHRVKIDDATGTAASSGPWTEELLPAESVLHGLAASRSTVWVEGDDPKNTPNREVSAAESRDALGRLLEGDPVLRFGGKASVGFGRARVLLQREG